MSKGKSPLLIGKMPDGDGLFLLGQVFEFDKSVGAINRKKYVRKSRCQSILDPLGFPSSTHTTLEISPKFALIHTSIITRHCCNDATCLTHPFGGHIMLIPGACFNRGVVNNLIKETNHEKQTH